MTGKQLKNSILQWAIQGHLVPQNEADEPAAKLLERIREEKERLIKEKKIKRDKNATTIYRDGNSYYEKNSATGKAVCIDDEIPFQIPEGWEWVRLGEIFNIWSARRVHEKDWRSSGIPFYRAREIGKLAEYGHVDNDLFIDKTLYDEFSKSGLPQIGDLMMTAVGTLGKTYIVQTDTPFYFKDGSVLCIGNTYNLNAKFLKVFFESDAFARQYLLESDGTTVATLTMVRMNKYLLPLPPLPEQERIVSKIEELMPLVERYGAKNDELQKLNATISQKLRKSILQEAIQGRLVPQNPDDEPAAKLLERIRHEKERLIKEKKIKRDKNATTIYRDGNSFYEKNSATGKAVCIDDEIPFQIPEGWEWCRMGAIGDWGAGATPAKGNSNYYGGDILWLRTGELNNSYVYDTEIKITELAFKECSLRMNKVGDVLIAMYGATIGKVAIVGTPMTTNQACCGCTPILVYNKYLFYFLMASKDEFASKGEGGAQPNISREKLIHHLLPLPPLPEQERIVSKIEEAFSRLG